MCPGSSERCLHFQNLIWYVSSTHPKISVSPKTSVTLRLNSIQPTFCLYISLIPQQLAKIDSFHFYTEFKFSIRKGKHSSLTKFIKYWYSNTDFIGTILVLIFKIPSRINTFYPCGGRKSRSMTYHFAVYISHLLE